MLRLHVCAVGRLRAGPEHDLYADYAARVDKTGRALGLGPLSLHEVDDRRGGGMATEGVLLARAVPEWARMIALDERGGQMTSPEFAALLARLRDDGAADAAFVIGGADGLDPTLRARADHALSLGPMVWPHMLVRVMLAEQLYRAATILSGGPYHRA